MDSQDRTEDLLVEETVVRRVNLVDSRLDEVSNGAIVLATGNELDLRVLVALVNDLLDLLERATVDNGTHESLEVLVGATLGNVLHLLSHEGEELLGARLGDVGAGCSRALLALVLEGTANGVVDNVVDVGRGVDEVEVLARGLADNAGEIAVSLLSNTLADLAVDGAEDIGGSDEVETGEFAVLEDSLGDLGGVTGDELDDIFGKTGFLEDLVDDVAGVDVVLRRLPEDNVSEDSGRDQVTTDGGEVEWRNGVDESLERSVVNARPDTVCTPLRLLAHDLGGVVTRQSEEIGQLSSSVNLALPNVLALSKHGRSNQLITVLGCRQLGGALEDSRSINERCVLPVLLRLEGGLDSSADLLFAGERVVCESGSMLCGEDLVLVGVDLLGDAVEDDLALEGELRAELL